MSKAMKFDRTTTAQQVVEGADLRGRIALVTGGGAGIGLSTATALASAGAKVYIADVNDAAGADAVTHLRRTRPAATVEFTHLDLGSLSAVRAFAEAFRQAERRLDILVNNAGIMACPQAYTVDGHERQFGVNYLGHYLLTRLLEPSLRAAGRARVVCLSSIGHREKDIQYDDIDYRKRAYDRWEAYGQSKTACALLAIGVDARWRDRGIRSNTMNPGGSATGLHQFLDEAEQRRMGFLDANNKQPDRWRPPEQCAGTVTWLACAPELEGIGGKYFEDFAESKPWCPSEPSKGVKPYAISRENALRLWNVAAEMTGLPPEAPA